MYIIMRRVAHVEGLQASRKQPKPLPDRAERRRAGIVLPAARDRFRTIAWSVGVETFAQWGGLDQRW
jgi:hypothetical protein